MKGKFMSTHSFSLFKQSFICLIILLIFYSCDSEIKNNQPSLVNFNISSKTNEILVAFTNDHDSLWSKVEWVDEVKGIMKDLSNDHNTVLLFDSKEHTPNVAGEGMNYSLDYDKWSVCGYWRYPNGSKKFCYGGVKQDNNFKHCLDE